MANFTEEPRKSSERTGAEAEEGRIWTCRNHEKAFKIGAEFEADLYMNTNGSLIVVYTSSLQISKMVRFVILHTFIREFQRRQWHPTPVLLPGKPHGWRSLAGCSPWGS